MKNNHYAKQMKNELNEQLKFFNNRKEKCDLEYIKMTFDNFKQNLASDWNQQIPYSFLQWKIDLKIPSLKSIYKNWFGKYKPSWKFVIVNLNEVYEKKTKNLAKIALITEKKISKKDPIYSEIKEYIYKYINNLKEQGFIVKLTKKGIKISLPKEEQE